MASPRSSDKTLRLKRLEKWAVENTGVLSESQVQALETAKEKEEEEAHREIENHHPGYLVAQDTCYMEYIKGIGYLYQQTCIDTYSNVGFAKIYLEKTSLTAADFMKGKMLQFFDKEVGYRC